MKTDDLQCVLVLAPRKLSGGVDWLNIVHVPSQTRLRLVQIRRPSLLVGLSMTYLAAISGLMIWRGISVSPDYLLLLMVPIALLSGRMGAYIRDWVPFIALFLGYEAMRGVADKTGIAPHIGELIEADDFMFWGHNPTALLQSWFGSLNVLIIICTVIYFCHFVMPIAMGLMLWLADRTQFRRFAVALLGMSFSAFFIFLIVPTAPPWYANNHGLLPGVSKLLSNVLPSAVSPYYNSLNANPVAAWPSLHAAYPFIGYLALRHNFPRAAWLALGWCIAVWFSVVFLGEHYVIDVISGIAYATIFWIFTVKVLVPRVSLLQTNSQPATSESV